MKLEIKMVLKLDDFQILDNSLKQNRKLELFLLEQPRTSGDHHITLHPESIEVKLLEH